jgi:hypothetical protein
MTTINHSARVGVITDQTGALSFMGIANLVSCSDVPGLTRQVQAGLAGGVAALYPDLPQKTA